MPYEFEFWREVMSNALNLNIAKQYITAENMFADSYLINECESTNALLKQEFANNPISGAVLASLSQTKGRGTGDKAFHSPQGGIYFSFSLIDLSSNNQSLLTVAACVSVYEAIYETCNLDCLIKWVNDIYYNGKKLCGILTENVDGGYICGIGLNVFRASDGLYPQKAGAIDDYIDERNIDINRLFAQIINRLEANLFYSSKEDVLEVYRRRSMLIGKTVSFRYSNEPMQGIAIGIDSSNAALLVQTGLETIALTSGEAMIYGVDGNEL